MLLAIYEGGLDSVGIVTIDTVTGTISAGTVDEWEDRDRSVTDGIEDLRDQYTRTYSGAIALAKADLVAGEAEDTDLVRSQETNLGDLCADVYRSETGADAAIVAGSCFCRGIAAGQITRDDVLGAVSETEVLFVAELSGQQILDILELGATESPEPSDSFTQVSGLRYSIDTSIPSPVSFDEDSGEWTIEGERRIGGVEIGGEPLDADETYTVALSGSFIIEAIDGIDQGEEYTEADSTGGEALVRYIRDTLRGDLSGYQDPEGQDRIAFVSTEEVGDAGTAQQESVYYVVRIGDSLWGIAKRELGSGSRWVEIYETNRDSIASPELIYPGMELLMP